MLDLKSLPNVPRYTSYPTAPQFTQEAAVSAHRTLLASINDHEPISVYIHVPYCDRLCWFCGCHTKHTLKYEPVSSYVEHLVREVRQFGDRLGFKPILGHLHFGGGSPSILQKKEAGELDRVLRQTFQYTSQTEISVEIDPNDIEDDNLDAMMVLGMTRASIGVQDFREDVQEAINRPQSYEDTARLATAIRSQGIGSLNIDALYGLPNQTVASIRATAAQIMEIRPDRIALFGYAHVPHLKKHQQMIQTTRLPDDGERLEQSNAARKVFLENGYVEIGIDHFALPEDGLVTVAKQGTLKRNFQGYTADRCDTLIGFGASAISYCKTAYVQNTVPTNLYKQLVSDGTSTAARGMLLNQEDCTRAEIIEALMCNFAVNFCAMEVTHGRSMEHYRREAAITALGPLSEICSFDGDTLRIQDDKRDFVRLVASSFDEYLDTGKSQYSKAV